MTMGTKVFNNALDMISFSRASGGTALRKISYGPELVTNGTFDTDTSGWTEFSADVSFDVRGAIRVESNGIFNSSARQTNITTKIGAVYLCTFDVVEAALGGGGVSRVGLWASASDVSFYGTVIIPRTVTTRTTYTFVAVATSASSTFRLGIGSNTGFAVFDNISVKEVLFDRPDGTLTLFNHPVNIPRIEYDAAGAVKGLLVEEARTNLLLRSEEFDNAAWTKAGAGAAGTPVVVANAGVAPDGTSNADRVQFTLNGGTATGDVADIRATASVSAGSHTLSFWVKAFDGASTYQMLVRDANGIINQLLVTGSWQRYTVTATYGAGTATVGLGIRGGQTPTNSNTADILIYGAQLEAGAFPTSYIPTVGATATRAADIASIPVSAFGYNQGAGSVVIEAQTLSTAANNHQDFHLLNLSAPTNTISSGSRVGSGVAGQYTLWVQSNGSTVALISKTSVISDNTFYKAAWAAAENDFALTVDGQAVVTDAAGAMPTAATEARIGYGAYGRINGHIKSIRYFPRRLSNAQLQELTS